MRFENYQPTKNLQADALIDLQTVDPTDIFEILSEAIRLKVAAKVGEVNNTLQNKKIVLITNQKLGLAQLTFRLSVVGLGAEPITVQLGGSGIEAFLGAKETTQTLSRLGIDAFVVETGLYKDAETLYKQLYKPVINAFDGDSPCDALSMLFSVHERLGKLSNLNVAYISEGNKLDSTLSAFIKCGLNITFVCPEDKKPTEEIFNYAAAHVHAHVEHDLDKALQSCDVLFIDNEFGESYKITKEKLKLLSRDACVLHPTPLTGKLDADIDILDDNRSLIANFGANLVYIQSAILELLLDNNY